MSVSPKADLHQLIDRLSEQESRLVREIVKDIIEYRGESDVMSLSDAAATLGLSSRKTLRSFRARCCQGSR